MDPMRHDFNPDGFCRKCAAKRLNNDRAHFYCTGDPLWRFVSERTRLHPVEYTVYTMRWMGAK